VDVRIIRAKLAEINRRSVLARWPITGWEARTADHLAPGEYAYRGDWQPLVGPGAWPAGKTVFLRCRAQAPLDVPAGELCFQYEGTDLEGLLSVNGRSYAGLDENHPRVQIPAGTLDLFVEASCVPSVLYRPERKDDAAVLRSAAFVRIDRAIEAAYYDLWFTWEASQHAADERRRQHLADALEDALLCIDLTAPADRFSQEVATGRELLNGRIHAIARDPEGGRMFLTGHSHIDTAWLWPLRETVRKCGRTFATACRLMERYPDYRFSCSQPQLYLYTKQHYPALYEEIKKWVAAGRWECTGGMWVESDCNVPSAEALIRQFLHGKRFFRQEFGVRPDSCWLPDVFGYPASLPGILLGCGIEDFMTVKLHWQARNRFPMGLFWWEGVDGSRVLADIAKLPHMYNGSPTPEQLTRGWDDYPQKADYDEVLFAFGYGDGGGGPTEMMLEFAQRGQDFPGVPVCRQGLGEQFFDIVREANPELPTWVGELYLETHRGTYTTHGEIKKANRKNELLLRDAEIFGVLANAQGAGVDLSPLDAAWQNLLLLQFHDILPGSSIGPVYAEAAVNHAKIAATAAGVRGAAIIALAARAGQPGQIVAFNSLSWPRSDAAPATIPATIVPASGDLELVDGEGNAIPAQVTGIYGNSLGIVFTPQSLPPMGYATYALRAAAGPAESSFQVSERRLENRFFSIELNADGTLARLLDKRANREVIPAGKRGNQLQLFQDGPEREAAWNIHATFEGREYAWDPNVKIEVVEAGPVRAAVRVTRTYRASTLVQDVVIYDTLPRIDFVTRVDWQERQVLLKAAFPVDVRAMSATYEIQHAAVERPTHRNTSWDAEKFEVCAHHWADLSEPGYGVSLLNDCKYGHDVHGNVLRITLLRSPEWPDPEADRGAHEFTYALLPHLGEWHEAETVRRGWELNVPVVCTLSTAEKPSLPFVASFFCVDGPALLDTIKPAEDGAGCVLRFYEPNGGRGRVTVTSELPMGRVRGCNHVEEVGEEVAVEGNSFSFTIKPFEIRSFMVE
jgi:alpha-mannosidase